jgi:predicted component of type VI protein secretion system
MDQATPPSDSARALAPGLARATELTFDFVPLRLVLQGGEMAISLLRPDMVVGRHSETDVRLPLPDVSRRHCRFVFTENHWQVFDLNSLNGVHINGHRVQQATLAHKDVVRIGSFNFEVDLHSGPGSARAAASGSEKCNVFLKTISQAIPIHAQDSATPKRQAS